MTQADEGRPIIEPITVTVKQFCGISNLSKESIYKLIRSGDIRSVVICGRRLIDMRSYRELIDRPSDRAPTRGLGSGNARRSAATGAPMRWLRKHVSYDGQDCLIWPFSRLANGYAQLSGGRIASREMCRLAHGEPQSPEFQAAHSCGKGHEGCVSPQHIRWATRSQNEDDKLEHGTRLRGELSPVAKLTLADIRAIREMAGRLRQREIAKQFGVTQSTISVILSRASWGHVE